MTAALEIARPDAEDLALDEDRIGRLKRSMVIKVAEDMMGKNRLAYAIVHDVKVEIEVLEWDWACDEDLLVPASEQAHIYEGGRIENRLLVRLTIDNYVWSAYANRGEWSVIRPTSTCSWPRRKEY